MYCIDTEPSGFVALCRMGTKPQRSKRIAELNTMLGGRQSA